MLRRRAPSLATRAALLVAAAACAPNVEPFTLPVDGAGALLLVTVPTSGAPTVNALELRDPTPAYLGLPYPKAASAEVYALSFSCPLAALGLVPGPQTLTTDAAGLLLPTAGRAWRTSAWRDGLGSTWAPIDTLPAAVRALRLVATAPSPCITLDVEDVTLDDRDYGELLVSLGDGTFLAGGAHGNLFHVAPGLVERLDLPADTPHAAGFRAADGEVWLRDWDGRVAHGDLTRGFVEHPARAPAHLDQGRIWMAGPTDPSAPFELFAVIQSGELEHFDGTTWSVLDPGVGRREAKWGGVVWRSPGDALAVGPRDGTLLAWTAGAAHEEAIVADSSALTSLDEVPGTGLLLGTFFGAIYLGDGRTWNTIPLSSDRGGGPNPLNLSVTAFAPLERGALIGAEKGIVIQYQPGYGFCEGLITSGTRHTSRMARSGQVIAVLPQGELRVMLLTPRPPEHRCDGPAGG